MSFPLLRPREAAAATRALLRSGLVRPYRPDLLGHVALGLRRYGFGPAMGPRAGATLHPDLPAVLDERGSASQAELDEQCTAVAAGLRDAGLVPGDGLGLLARNSAGFYRAMVGAARLGADVTYLNTGFTAEQVADVVEAQGLRAVVYDGELADRVPHSVRRIPLDASAPAGDATSIEEMASVGARHPASPARPSRHVILTSGTTGRPKGAARTGGGVDSVVALLTGLPYRARETHLVVAPMFHAWGWMNTLLTMLLSSNLVTARRFDPEQTLALVERHRAEVLVAVPVMLQRILALPAEVLDRYDTSSLRVVAVSGSPLPEQLSQAFMDRFGDVLYNLYGSTEAAFATVAGPADLRAAPGTAGRPLPGVRVRIVDDDGHDCPPGTPGAIRVRSGDSMTVGDGARPPGQGRKLADTGDLGWFDEAGRLFVGAREDDMIVSGGENVYPVVVEQALHGHPEVAEVAVVGVEDDRFGQALVAHVVLRPGSSAGPDAVREWCKAHLAPFQVPREVVVRESLPHNETGKVVKSALRDGD